MSEEAPQFIQPYQAPAHVRRAGKTMLWVGFAVPLIAYAGVVLSAPLDALERFPALKSAANGVHSWVLSKWSFADIYKHARSTAFPQVAMLASAMGFCIAVFMAIACNVQTFLFHRHLVPLSRADERSVKQWLIYLFGLPISAALCFWAVYCIKGDWSRSPGLTTQIRGGYLFITAPTIAFLGIAVGVWPMQVRLFIGLIFPPKRS